ncbi:hypothetical protein CN605_27965 [Bacillus toyonensis]|uniref:hypothetical protein n=1 Tax=Bacillus toyonensis TaxID=155322 RepID=UPI000BF03B44|nr:hypothetical protein [Bacillus toyonensis]PEL35491.1 hypothetical protein CN605_27965 [Bacillus toyonensis]
MKGCVITVSDSNLPVVWGANQGISIPKKELLHMETIVDYNKRLYPREVQTIVKAFNNDLYDMAIEYTWTRTFNILRERVMSFGKDFVLEMLGRSDEENLDSLSEVDTVRLAADLGIINETAKMRFMHVIELIQHYSSRKAPEDEEINPLDVLNNVGMCVKYVLGFEEDGFIIEYSAFRDRLKTERLSTDDVAVETLKLAPYFYKRTTVNTLLNLIKRTKSGEQENVFANMNIIVPAVWDDLLSDDRYPLGFSYAEAINEGDQKLVSAFKSVLLKVQGFDYVPEDLRSRSFIAVAKNLLDVHYGIDNFYKEPAAAKSLMSMGTTIPKPAIGAVVSATLACKVGNSHGVSNLAQEYLDKILGTLSNEQWEHYFNSVFPVDETMIYKLIYGNSRINERWTKLVEIYSLDLLNFKNTKIKNLILASKSSNYGRVRTILDELKVSLRGE